MPRFPIAALVGGLLLATAAVPRAETTPPSPPAINNTAEAGDADAVEPVRKLKWNEYDWKYSTFRFGFGLLVDYADYSQDEDSKEQVSLDNGDVGLRDFRLLFKGQFKTKRRITWTLGYMYDGTDEDWHFRQTGIQVDVPELHGRLFVGRTKEGYSLIKLMVGYHGWNIERAAANDAFVPILADGVKWMGYHPEPHVFYSLGLYDDALSENETFSTYEYQTAARVGWNPAWDAGQQVFHAALMGRVGKPDGGRLQVRARGGSFLTGYFLDTGPIRSDLAVGTGVEAYYRTGPWLFGVAYNWLDVQAEAAKDPTFLQRPGRVLRSGVPAAARVRGRARCLGSRRRFLVCGFRRPVVRGRQVLARDAADELAHVGQRADGVRLRVRHARPLRRRGAHALLPVSDAADALGRVGGSSR
jgi:phosphate-selective porin OprO/OprP